MITVGITGGIGCGKTLVSNIIGAMGYPVYIADKEARLLTNSNPSIIKGVKNIFGDDIYAKGELDRERVGKEVFSNKVLLSQLNSIIHPVVFEHFKQWTIAHSNSKLVFKEAAVLFESGANKLVDKTVAIWAPQNLRIARVCRRDGVDEKAVLSRMANQLSDADLISLSDFVIKNDEENLLVPQIVMLITQLLKD